MVWYMWASLGVFAIVFEVASPTFFAGFIGIGFLGAAVLSYFIPDSLIFQLLEVLAGMFAGAFIFKRRKMGDTPMSKIGQSDEFIGVQGLVVESLDAEHLGLVLLNTPVLGNAKWSALSHDGTAFVKGERIEIVSIHAKHLSVKHAN